MPLRPFAAVIAAALALAAAAAAADTFAKFQQRIARHCEAEWPSDYRMQEYCRERQLDALIELSHMLEAHPEGTEGSRIIARCIHDWPAPTGGSDYRMVVYCAERQLGAYERLNQ